MGNGSDTEAEGFRAIGKFIVEFSQLEFSIRARLAGLLKLSDEQFDPVTSAYDFIKLCTVTETIFVQQYPPIKDRVKKVFTECRTLNDERVKIVHGLWQPWGTGLRRVLGKMKVDWFFADPDRLYRLADQAQNLMNKVLLLGNSAPD